MGNYGMKLEGQVNDMSEYVLEMQDITKVFSGNAVLDKAELKVKSGEVHALMGENGAGKSTLMKILMGIYQKDGGKVFLNGEETEFSNPKQALEHGIAMIHQELNPVLDMKICENVFMGKEPYRRVAGIKIVDKVSMREETKKYLEYVGLDKNADTLMRTLSVAQTQMVEIAKAISWDAKIIIMDEPTSAITDREVEILFGLIERLKKQGVSIIYISHKLDEIYRICDTMTVLRDGKYIGRDKKGNIDSDKLISMMVGRQIDDIYPKTDVPRGEVVLEVKGLTLEDKVKDASFKLHRGEILGIAGLVGAGRSEMVETIFGLRKKTSGEIYVHGEKVEISTPGVAISKKIGLVTEDRKVSGLNLIGSVRENICSVSIKELLAHHLTNKKKECEITDHYIDKMKIKTSSREKKVELLSGGNQQKVSISKWLLGNPDIIIMDEPTRGIDVGAKRDIYLLMGELAAAGKAVLMISSEMPEVMGLSDRIIVLSNGKITGEVERCDFDQEVIMKMQFDSMNTEVRSETEEK